MAQGKEAIQNLTVAGIDEYKQLNAAPTPDFATPGMQIFKLGDWNLQSGEIIPDAFIAYKTYGDASLPAIIYPSWYSGCRYSLLLRVTRA